MTTAKTYMVNGKDWLPPDDGAPITEEQAARLRELSRAAGEEFDGQLTRRQAARRIAYLEETLN